MKLIIHFKHGGCYIVHSEDKEETMKIFNRFKMVNFNKEENFISSNVVIPYNEIKFIELQES
ncbi:hypothetical protein [Bacillus sp. NPDC094106]|uniref:hypothetical protein n=1 Tax=Bacillus sp. NPDC094106 TaxID=3363949 RepID=UPI0037FB60F0